MIAIDETALVCDLAETYGILNYKGLPAITAAALSAGLRDNSRIKIKMSGGKTSFELMLMAVIADRLGDLVYLNSDTKDRPPSFARLILGEESENEKTKTFKTAEEFEAAWKEATMNGN